MNGYFGSQCQFNRLNSTLSPGSIILDINLGIKLVNLTNLPLTKSPFQLLYQASIDGFSASSFHSKCDGVQGTFIVMKSNYSNIFGGYTSADWSGNYQYKYDSSAFLFSLVNSYNMSLKMNIISTNNAIYTGSSYSVTFGGGFDLSCYDNQNTRLFTSTKTHFCRELKILQNCVFIFFVDDYHLFLLFHHFGVIISI